SDSELVDSVANGVDGLINRLVAIGLFLGRLQTYAVRVRHFARSRNQVPLAKTFTQDRSKLTVLVRVDADDLKSVVLRPGDLAKDGVPFVELLAHRFDRLVCFASNRIVGDDLEDEVRTSPQIEPQLYVL